MVDPRGLWRHQWISEALTSPNDEIRSAHLMIIVVGLNKLYDYEALAMLTTLLLHLAT